MGNEEREHLTKLLQIHRRNLYGLEEQAASQGGSIPTSLSNDILQEKQEIASIEAKLGLNSSLIDRATPGGISMRKVTADFIDWTQVAKFLAHLVATCPSGTDIQVKLSVTFTMREGRERH
jgi:hypothetical protein